MKLSRGLALSTLCSAASAAREGHVYVYDKVPGSLPQAPTTVTPETARLILARRMGLSDFHSLENPSEDTIRNLNVYGGNQPKLFGGHRQNDLKMQTVMWIDDVEDFEVFASCFQDKDWMKLTVSDPPSTSDNERLIEDMALQTNALDDHTRKSGSDSDSKNEFLNDWLRVASRNYDVVRKTTQKNECPFSHHNSVTPSMTVVLMPPSSPKSKRRVQPYGPYTVPSPDHLRREVAEAHISKETPLSLASTTPDLPDDLETFPVITAAKEKGDNTTAPLGILKTCYESQSKCVAATNACTGHGKCVNRNGGKKERGFDCWHCACEAEVKMHDGKGMETGKKTVYWGGPACQKKDISTPFWLLTGTAVLLAFLISSGIGLMYSMGAEELPSVIGAGVSGPSRK
ncbi:unnamed protein product [Periconia digitata]|uniref:DUF3844 domain-containing protein n=1 Tax=Periconia digitata TaxID=1303443 RepID=A0A9W4U4A5_9PLEO|nr:unnamed protein product [Periconia digitata]